MSAGRLQAEHGVICSQKQAWWNAGMARMTDAAKAACEGAWLRVSEDGGGTWESPVKAPLNSPHGPIRRRDGSLLYLGKECHTFDELNTGKIVGMASRDDGPDSDLGYPATVELPGGELLSVYYQKPQAAEDKCALLCSRWRLP